MLPQVKKSITMLLFLLLIPLAVIADNAPEANE